MNSTTKTLVAVAPLAAGVFGIYQAVQKNEKFYSGAGRFFVYSAAASLITALVYKMVK